MTTYCDTAPGHPFHGPYHDKEYGFPVTDESILLERLSLEIFQAGLSWLIVLKKREGFKIAFKDFDVETVAAFTNNDVERLLKDTSIIRNRKKLKPSSTMHSKSLRFETAMAVLPRGSSTIIRWPKRNG